MPQHTKRCWKLKDSCAVKKGGQPETFVFGLSPFFVGFSNFSYQGLRKKPALVKQVLNYEKNLVAELK
jgi:hypothetical protein